MASADRSIQGAGVPNPSRGDLMEGRFSVFADQSLRSTWHFSHDGWIVLKSFFPSEVSRIVWFRPPEAVRTRASLFVS